jgi:hypothetical protein
MHQSFEALDQVEGPVMTLERPKILLTFEALPSAVPVGRRLAQLLKHALRVQELKCIKVQGGEPIAADKTQDVQQASPEDTGPTD